VWHAAYVEIKQRLRPDQLPAKTTPLHIAASQLRTFAVQYMHSQCLGA
jgi:hypothetical protein